MLSLVYILRLVHVEHLHVGRKNIQPYPLDNAIFYQPKRIDIFHIYENIVDTHYS